MLNPIRGGEKRRDAQLRTQSGGVDPTCQFRAAELKTLMAYWESRRPAPDRLPGRAHIDPLEIPLLLPNVFLVDVIQEPREYRYRVFGTKLVDAYGIDITNKKLHEVFSDIFRKAAISVFNYVVETRAPLRTYGTLVWFEKQHIRFEGVQMPLAADGAEVNMILGAVIFGGSPK